MAVVGAATHRAGGVTNDLFQQAQPQTGSPVYQSPPDPVSRVGRQRVLSEQGTGSCAFGFTASANGVVPGVLTVTRSIVAGSDDAQEPPGLAPQLAEGNHLADVVDDQFGTRFTDLPFQQGATISQAIVTQTLLTSSKNDAEGTWFGHDDDDSATFTTTEGDITGRTHTTASVAWTQNDLGDPGDAATSPNLAAILQEIVDRPGWQPGNNMSLIYVHNSTTDKIEVATFENATYPEASLYVEYRPVPQVTGVGDVFFGFTATVTLTQAAATAGTGIGTANSPAGAVATTAGSPAGTGTANNATAAVTPTAGSPAATGTANNATVVTSAAFPAFEIGTPHSSGTGATSRNVDFGATLAAGDGMILLLDHRDGTITFPGTPWTQPTGGPTTQNNFSFDCFALVASGGETSVTLTTQSAVVMIVYPIRVPAGSWDSSQAIEVTTATATNDPPSETASWGADDNGWIANVFSNSGTTYTVFPTGFDNDQLAVDSIFDTLNTAVATKDDAVATLDPTAFTPAGGARSITATVVVRGAAAAGTTASAGNATGTGTANSAAATVAPTAESPTGAGAANNATALVAVAAPAGVAAASGSANPAASAVAPTPSTGTAAGTAATPTLAVASTVGLASATAAAGTPTSTVATTPATAPGGGAAAAASTTLAVPAGTATGTGTAAQTTQAAQASSGTATAAGVAHNPTVQTGSTTTASAAPAVGSGSAAAPTLAVAASAQASAATGDAQPAAGSVSFDSSAAAGTGAANNATVQATVAADVATGTGTANSPARTIQIVPLLATAAGQAFAATVFGDTADPNPIRVTYTEPGRPTFLEPVGVVYQEQR